MSIYLIAWERNLHQHSPIVVNAIRLLERWATRLPNLLIMDTAEYVNWFQQTHAVNSDRCRLIPTGADSNIFRPVSHHTTVNKRLRVVYYGSYIPNHGVLNIVEAAALLQERPEIQFEMIGDGPMRHQAESLAQSYQLTNITFLDWLTQESLVEHVGSADLCLGVFGTTPQSLMTVQNKIYECLAMARPVLSGVGPAVQAALSDGIEIYLCERANPQALASAIEDLYAAPEVRKRIGEMGYRRFLLEYDLSQIGAVFLKHIRETIER
jgi:glycosyltransferase involved in cell wall biosynthesis